MQNVPHNNTQPRVNYTQIEDIKKTAFDKIIPKKYGRAWSSLQLRPRAQIADLSAHEKVYIIGRRHWITNLSWVSSNILYCFVPIIIFLVLDFLNIGIDEVSLKTYFVIVLAYYSVVFTNVIRDFFDWYFDPFVVTNERVMDFEFKPFTSYVVKDSRLENIEKVSERSVGIVSSIFNYGDIIITTEGEGGVIVFEHVKNPQMVRRVLDQLIEISKKYTHVE